MQLINNKDFKTLGEGRGGKCRLLYSDKFERLVVEKTPGNEFLRTKNDNRSRLTTLINDYSTNKDSLEKEMVFMTLLKTAKLDCCVEILDFHSNPFRIIMEYCEGGDLRNILDTYKDIPVSDKIHMISQILVAVKRIHEFGIIHGDLKCANIFLAYEYKPGKYKDIKIKIGDFGLSEIGGNLFYGGSAGFMAPEVPLIGGSFDSDIYSLGKVMLEIMTQLPVEMIRSINSSNIYSLKNKLPRLLDIDKFYDIVIPCLNKDYKKRPTADKLIKHFRALIKLCIIAEDMNFHILSKYKLGESVPVDIHSHPLILSNDEMRRYKGNGWYCSICQNKNHLYFSSILSFHCHECKYNLCDICIEKHDYRVVNEKMEKRAQKGQKVYVTPHPHYLLLKGKEERHIGGDSNSWCCDICNVSACDSVYSFHCEKCGYNVCLGCFEKNFEVKGREKDCCIIF